MGDPISSLYGSIDVYSRLAGLSAPGLLFFTSRKSLTHAWLRSGNIEPVQWELPLDILNFTSVDGLHWRLLEVHRFKQKFYTVLGVSFTSTANEYGR